jgi:hypothetical protein
LPPIVALPWLGRQAEEHPQRRRLARAVGPEEAGHGSFASGEAQVVDCGYLAEAL